VTGHDWLGEILSRIDQTLEDYENSKTAEPPPINGKTALLHTKPKACFCTYGTSDPRCCVNKEN
jgi:hypothetical protein